MADTKEPEEKENTCPCCGQVICEEPWDFQDSDDWDDEFDEMTEEERRFEENCETAASCTCGAWVFNAKGHPVHIADCFCGAE